MKLPAFIYKAVDAVSRFRPGKKLAKRFGYSTLFSVLFSFFLFWSLPIGRFAPNIENFLSNALGRTVRIGDIHTTLSGAVVLSDVEIGLGEKKEVEGEEAHEDEGVEADEAADAESSGADAADTDSEKASGASKSKLSPMYLFEELKVKVSALAMMFGGLDMDVTLSGLGGTVSMSYEGPLPRKKSGDDDLLDTEKTDAQKRAEAKAKRRIARSRKSAKAGDKNPADEEAAEDKDDEQASSAQEDSEDGDEDEAVAFHLKAEDINLKLIHDLRDALPVPLVGTVNIEIDLASESAFWSEASGKIAFSIHDLLLSKGGYEAVIFGSTLAVPPLAVSSIEGEIVFEKGVGKVTMMKVVSKYLDILLKGEVALGKKLKESTTDLYAAFKIQDAYLNQSEAIRTIMESADVFSPKAKQAHRDDGYFGFSYQGILGKGRLSPSKEYTGGDDKKAKAAKDKKKRRKPPKNSRMKSPFPSGEDDMEDDGASTSFSPQGDMPQNMRTGQNRNFGNQSTGPGQFQPQEPPPMQVPERPPFNPDHRTMPNGPGTNHKQAMDNQEPAPPEEAAPAVEAEPPQPQEEVQPEQQEEEEAPPPEEEAPAEQEEAEETPPPPKPAVDPDEIY